MFRKLLLASMIALAGCSGDTATSPSEDSIDGVWRIVSIQPGTQAMQPAPAGVLYQVSFDDDRVGVRVDCNTCTGPFTLRRGRLMIGPTLACTRAACATAAYETAVLDLLGGEHQVSTTLHNLTLSSSRGSVLLQR